MIKGKWILLTPYKSLNRKKYCRKSYTLHTTNMRIKLVKSTKTCVIPEAYDKYMKLRKALIISYTGKRQQCTSGNHIMCNEWWINKESFITWAIQNGYTSSAMQVVRKTRKKEFSPDNCVIWDSIAQVSTFHDLPYHKLLYRRKKGMAMLDAINHIRSGERFLNG